GGGHDIPLSIEAHAVNPPLRSPVILAELMQDNVAAQRAVRLNVVGSQLPPLRVGLDHVEGALVRGGQQAIGASRLVEGHALAHLGAIGLRVSAQDRVTARYLLLAGIDVASVPRIAEPYATLTVNGQVVWGIEWLTVQPIHDGRRTAIGL